MAVQTITYGNKQYLNQNANIPATNKVQDTDMNEIKSVVNNNATETSNNTTNIGNLSNLATENKTSIVNSINELKNAEVYSTNEVKTNKVWIDGKPIYRKIITYNGNISSSYDTNIVNFERLISLYGTAKLENTFWVQISNNNITTNGVFCTLYLNSTGTTINVTKSGNSFYDGSIIIEYTKTTD